MILVVSSVVGFDDVSLYNYASFDSGEDGWVVYLLVRGWFVTRTYEKLVDAEQKGATRCGTRVGANKPLETPFRRVFADLRGVLFEEVVVQDQMPLVVEARCKDSDCETAREILAVLTADEHLSATCKLRGRMVEGVMCLLDGGRKDCADSGESFLVGRHVKLKHFRFGFGLRSQTDR